MCGSSPCSGGLLRPERLRAGTRLAPCSEHGSFPRDPEEEEEAGERCWDRSRRLPRAVLGARAAGRARGRSPERREPAQALGRRALSPVDTYHAEGHDGGRAAHDVHGDEDVAEEAPEDPLAADEVGDADEGHDGQGHREIGQGQRDDEIVGGLPQLLHEADGDHHQAVAGDGQEGDEAEHGPDENFLGVAVAEDLLPALGVVGGDGARRGQRRRGGRRAELGQAARGPGAGDHPATAQRPRVLQHQGPEVTVEVAAVQGEHHVGVSSP